MTLSDPCQRPRSARSVGVSAWERTWGRETSPMTRASAVGVNGFCSRARRSITWPSKSMARPGPISWWAVTTALNWRLPSVSVSEGSTLRA